MLDNRPGLMAQLRRLRAAQWQMPGSSCEMEARMFIVLERLLRENGRQTPWTNEADRQMINITDTYDRLLVDIEPTDGFADAYSLEFDDSGELISMNCYAAEPLVIPDL